MPSLFLLVLGPCFSRTFSARSAWFATAPLHVQGSFVISEDMATSVFRAGKIVRAVAVSGAADTLVRLARYRPHTDRIRSAYRPAWVEEHAPVLRLVPVCGGVVRRQGAGYAGRGWRANRSPARPIQSAARGVVGYFSGSRSDQRIRRLATMRASRGSRSTGPVVSIRTRSGGASSVPRLTTRTEAPTLGRLVTMVRDTATHHRPGAQRWHGRCRRCPGHIRPYLAPTRQRLRGDSP